MSSPRLPRLTALAIVLAVIPLPSAHAANELDAHIQEIIHRPEYKHSRWGLLVVDADSGKTVYEHNADRLFFPASVTKLFTCSAALITLGPNYRFRTPVYRRGELVDGTLKGDLILVARGDPTLGGRTDAAGCLAFTNIDHTYATFVSTLPELTRTDPLAGLRDLARQVRKAGVSKVEGDVLIDDRMYPPSFGTGSGPKLITPIIVNDNVIDVIVSPGKAEGDRASTEIRPTNGFIHIDVQVETVAADQKAKITVDLVGLGRYVLRGKIPLGSHPLVRICPVADPELFARGLFIETLRREGVVVTASSLARPTAVLPDKDAYAGLTTAARLESPPLSELLKVVLKVSHNLYASSLPLLIAAHHGKRTLADGLVLERRIFADLGVDVNDLALESGAGGGACDHVTPRATVRLLQAMSRRPDFDALRSALPILGVDGTLSDVVGRDSPARGKVRAKTGTYVDTDLLNDRMFLRSKSLAGVMTTRSGRHLLFAFFLNDVPLPTGTTSVRDGKVLAQLCEYLYLHVP
jgi:D-alanyl-D-alanine carboxypeptidase/D-alanyl-D-alanine-endopeptidase (penicillin-binding protein 4)